jgi:peptidoglycan/xylan/chitin deacetylase (PgdA/CDA1 family)
VPVLLVSFFLNCAKAQSFFTIVDDDASSIEAISSVKRVADKRNVKISFAVIADKLLKNKELSDILLDYQSQGHHICNHSLTHKRQVWKEPTKDEIEFEIEESEFILDSMGFRNHNYLVYPFGKFDKTTYDWLIPLVSNTFNMAFESRGYGNVIQNTNRYNIARFPLRKHDNMFVVKRIIDQAAAKGQWLVFLNHSGMNRDFSERMLEDVITYCQYKGMQNVTIREAWERGIRLSDNAEPSVWKPYNEMLYLLYTHLGWVIGVFFLLIVIIVFLSKKLFKSLEAKERFRNFVRK